MNYLYIDRLCSTISGMAHTYECTIHNKRFLNHILLEALKFKKNADVLRLFKDNTFSFKCFIFIMNYRL